MEKLNTLNFFEIHSLGKQMAALTGITEKMIPPIPSSQSVKSDTPGQQTTATAQPSGTDKDQQAASGKAGAAAAAAKAAAEKKAAAATRVASVKLLSYPEAAKINVLREIRKLKPGMNLMDSKKLVENLPQILQKDVLPDQQKEWKEALEAAGAKIDFV